VEIQKLLDGPKRDASVDAIWAFLDDAGLGHHCPAILETV
jgi:hypothetical protein